MTEEAGLLFRNALQAKAFRIKAKAMVLYVLSRAMSGGGQKESPART
jgi:hypothetical protein